MALQFIRKGHEFMVNTHYESEIKNTFIALKDFWVTDLPRLDNPEKMEAWLEENNFAIKRSLPYIEPQYGTYVPPWRLLYPEG